MYQINDILNTIIQGDTLDVLKQIPNDSIDCVITSPPYWSLRNYEIEGQLGQEKTFQEYIEKLITIFIEIKRILKPTGTCFVNIGDTYISKGATRHKGYVDPKYPNGRVGGDCEPSGLKQTIESKNLALIPFRFAVEMQNRGWIVRNTIIWHKPNCMPESAKDRFTVDFEYVFFFVKNQKYYFEQQLEEFAQSSIERVKYGITKNNKMMSGNYSIQYDNTIKLFKKANNGELNKRNKRCVWSITTKPFKGAHFATFPPDLIEPMIKAGCPEFVCKKCGKPREKQFCKKEHLGNEKPQSPKFKFSNSLVNSAGGRPFYYTEQRKYPVNQKEFAIFLKSYVKGHEQELDNVFTPTTWRHWIRTDNSGSALPDREQYLLLKQICGFPDDFDEQMTTTVTILVDDKGNKKEFCGWTDCGCGAGFEPGIVLDPFMGSGTTAVVAKKLGRNYIGIELNPKYIEIANKRINETKIVDDLFAVIQK